MGVLLMWRGRLGSPHGIEVKKDYKTEKLSR